MNNIPHIVDTGASVDKIDIAFEEWKPLLKHIMENKLLKAENKQLREQIQHLERQVYGGSTK
jgi:regulator of replication initiation timing